VVWVEGDNIYNNDIYFTRSTDGGETFSAGILIGGEQHQPLYQTLGGIATDDSGNVYIAFTDNRFGKELLFVTKATLESTNVTEQPSPLSSPEKEMLHQNYPNPFNAKTTIEYSIPYDSFVILNIYNIIGKKVRSLTKDSVPEGRHLVVWDGTNDNGVLVSSGIYLYKLETAHTTIVKKILLLR
jgi:hypothetical protein